MKVGKSIKAKAPKILISLFYHYSSFKKHFVQIFCMFPFVLLYLTCLFICLCLYGGCFKVFCMCPEGFVLGPDWKKCDDVDECAAGDLMNISISPVVTNPHARTDEKENRLRQRQLPPFVREHPRFPSLRLCPRIFSQRAGC